MNQLLKKLRFKEQNPVLLLDPPPEHENLAREFGVTVHGRPEGNYTFAVAFVRSLAETIESSAAVKKVLAPGGIFWLVYPKGTSKRYPNVDVNRDIAHAALKDLGLDGVAIAAVDDDWSAMRYKHLE